MGLRCNRWRRHVVDLRLAESNRAVRVIAGGHRRWRCPADEGRIMSYWWMLLFMMIVTFGPRYAPFALAGRIKLPSWVVVALDFVPIAVLTAIIVQVSAIRDGQISFALDNHHLTAALVATVIALTSKNLFMTVLGGLLVFGGLKWVVG